MQDGGLLPWFELARRIECVSGKARVTWRVEPRFDYGAETGAVSKRRGVPMFTSSRLQLAVLAFDGGEPEIEEGAVAGTIDMTRGDDGLLVLLGSGGEPTPVPPREEIDVRLRGTVDAWRRWTSGMDYDGEWRDEVVRSALALKLLVYAPSGAIAAAPTTSLPERIGGPRNFDYRYAWIRDASFSLDAFARLGLREQLHQSLSWLLDTTGRTHPRLAVFYGIDGSVPSNQSELGLRGYLGSTPVLVGNGAGGQLQLGAYGDFFDTVATYVSNGNTLDAETGVRLAEIADALCGIWRRPDSGIWELRGVERHYTTSKIGCWLAFDRAVWLAERGEIRPRAPTAGAVRPRPSGSSSRRAAGGRSGRPTGSPPTPMRWTQASSSPPGWAMPTPAASEWRARSRRSPKSSTPGGRCSTATPGWPTRRERSLPARFG